jgi:hypothetical protein
MTRLSAGDDASRESPVVIDPDLRFGAPSVGGISTESCGSSPKAATTTRISPTSSDRPWHRCVGHWRARRLKQREPGQAGGGPLLLRRRHVRPREPLVSGTSRLHLSWRPRWADHEAGAPPCAIKTPAGPGSEWSPTVANSAGSLSLETGISKMELKNLVGCAHAQYEAKSWSPELW